MHLVHDHVTFQNCFQLSVPGCSVNKTPSSQHPHVRLRDLEAPLAQVGAAAICERPHGRHLPGAGRLCCQPTLVIVVQHMRRLNLQPAAQHTSLSTATKRLGHLATPEGLSG